MCMQFKNAKSKIMASALDHVSYNLFSIIIIGVVIKNRYLYIFDDMQ